MSAEMCKCGRNRIFSGDNACEECIQMENKGDLISRKEVKDMLSKKFEGVKETGNCACVAYIEGGRTDMFYAIDCIPTAYDVEKVVEKLEIIRENRKNDAERSLHNGNEFMEYGYNCEISGIDKAIYMIEKGGNNE